MNVEKGSRLELFCDKMKLNILKKSKIDKCTDAYCRLQFVKRGFHMMCNRRRGVVGGGGGQNIQYYGLDQQTTS